MFTRVLLVFVLTAVAGWRPALADVEPGEKAVVLESPGGETVRIGTMLVSKANGRYQFKVEMDETKFSDQFLSMRPFKCIDGSPMYCHLAYPYTISNRFSDADMIDLAYTFLFITKSKTEYGINPYNGRFYSFRELDGALVGDVHAVDLDILAVPPEEGNLRPIGAEQLDTLQPESERFPRIRIQ